MTSIRQLLRGIRVVPVIVIDDASQAHETAAALIEGGIATAEITLRTPGALDAIAAVSSLRNFVVGAGTVLTTAQCDQVFDAGARYIVSPGFDEEVVAYASGLGLAVLPGVATATEVQRAAKSGLDIIKFFPADRLGGLETIAALAAPFPHLQFVPSGGVGPANSAAYLAHRAVFAVSGSWMATRALIAGGDFERIRDLSAEACAA